MRATGSVKVLSWNDNESPVYGGLSVECTCPDGVRQKTASIRGRLYVCKHAAAALESVADKGAPSMLEAAIKKRKYDMEESRRIQEAVMPGERQRIEHGIVKLGAEGLHSGRPSLGRSSEKQGDGR